jgi:hypothetical protein
MRDALSCRREEELRKGSRGILFAALVGAVALILTISTVPVRPVRAALPTPQSVDIYAQQDTYVNDEVGFTGWNYGGDLVLKCGYYSIFELDYGHRCILIQFDMSILPVDAVIISASLRLTLESGGGEELNVMRVASAWDERDVTWDTKPGVVATDPELPLTMFVGTSTLTEYSVSVTSWVEDWHSEVTVNHGLWLQPEEWAILGNDSRAAAASRPATMVGRLHTARGRDIRHALSRHRPR